MLRDDAARALGLPAGIAVAVGGADAPAAALGLGLGRAVDANGTVLISLGTGGQVLSPLDEPKVDPQGRLHGLAHVVPGQWCVMAAILSAAASLDWIVQAAPARTTRTAPASCSPWRPRPRPAATG